MDDDARLARTIRSCTAVLVAALAGILWGIGVVAKGVGWFDAGNGLQGWAALAVVAVAAYFVLAYHPSGIELWRRFED